MSALSQGMLDRLQLIVSSDDAAVRKQFYDACSQQMDVMRTGENHCWYKDHRATTNVKEVLLYLTNQLNAHPAGIVFGTIKENDVSGANISGTIQVPSDAPFNFSL